MAEDSKFPNEGTRVDLGEDLLADGTRAIEKPAEIPPPTATIEDDLQRAQIFVNERLLEDAKRTLWRVMRADAENPLAKQLLKEIEANELQELLGGELARRKLGALPQEAAENPQEVLVQLEHDLRLDLDKSEPRAVPDLFKDDMALQSYKSRVLKSASALKPRERVDVGVAHLEMGIFDVATALFETILGIEEFRIEGMYLLGLSLIYGGKAIEATIRLEPLARDLTLTESQKTDFLYLMGLAFEHLSDSQKAREFYRRVHKLNPKYRDVLEKLK